MKSHHKHPGKMPKTMVGERVHFRAPGDVKKKGGRGTSGTIKDEVWVLDKGRTAEEPATTPRFSWGQYCFFSQLIKWDSGKRSIRLGYYRKRAGEDHWEFGSQTTINSSPATIRALLAETIAKTEWYG